MSMVPLLLADDPARGPTAEEDELATRAAVTEAQAANQCAGLSLLAANSASSEPSKIIIHPDRAGMGTTR